MTLDSRPGSEDAIPYCTVIMPVRNEGDFIERSLGAVLEQDYPRDRLEVLVVDGRSEDDTRSIVSRLTRAARFGVQIIDNSERTVPHALNRALDLARGDVVIRIDGHCVVPQDYVRRCVELLESTGAACVGGVVRTFGRGLVARAIALGQSSRFGVGGVAFRTGAHAPRAVDTVAFGAYRRTIFDKIGSFATELVRNQDDEFNYRLTRSGETIWLDPSIEVVYHSRASLSALWRQYVEYGVYKVRVFQRIGGVPSFRHVVPSLFVLALIVSAAVSLVSRRALWIGAIAGPYAVSNLMASLWTARRDPVAIPLLPVVFATLHVAYGLGVLYGLWRWRGYFTSVPAEDAYTH